jgi:hypothetical protein
MRRRFFSVPPVNIHDGPQNLGTDEADLLFALLANVGMFREPQESSHQGSFLLPGKVAAAQPPRGT